MTNLKRKILSQVRALDIFQKYIDVDVRFGKAIKSPLRNDRNPSFNIYRNETGKVYYKDFAGDRGDCFQFVMRLFDVDFKTALEIIANDFGVMDIEGLEIPKRKTPVLPKINIRKRKEVEFLVKSWTGIGLDFWKRYGITPQALAEYDVKSLEWYVISGFKVKAKLSDPIFMYDYRNGGYKFYRPLTENRKYKFLSNTFATDVFGLNQLNNHQEIIVLCAGQKDVLSLFCNLGIRGIALNSEKNLYHEDLHIKLSSIAKNIMICYDRDETGREEAIKISNEYNIPLIDLRSFDFEGKDISDFFCEKISMKDHEGIDKLKNYINSLKDDNTN